MNGPQALHAARAAGARFRLDPSDAHLPADLAATVRTEAAWIADALAAEQVATSPLPWHRHGPGWLAVVEAGRLLLGPAGQRWRLTHRPGRIDPPTVVLAAGTLTDVLAAAEALAARPRPVAR